MKILLLGAEGQLGWELQRALAPLGSLTALGRQGLDGLCGDLGNAEGLRDTIRRLAPDLIVNAAAYTAVDRAETEPELAWAINAQAPALLAQAAAHSKALLVHYSTDYVFDGHGSQPWQETDAPAPLNSYGQTKLAGEQAIRDSGCRHLIFRTSWVYAARGQNFLRSMLRLAAERDELTVVADQIGAPTGAELLADVSAYCIATTLQQPTLEGTYHLAAAGEASWHDYARLVVTTARNAGLPLLAKAEDIQPIATSAYPTPAARPLNSRLCCQRLQQRFALQLPPWQQGVIRTVTELVACSALASPKTASSPAREKT